MRVVDLTTVVVGPICTRTLADYGADVIKIEAPGGDLLRTMAEGGRRSRHVGQVHQLQPQQALDRPRSQKPEGHAALLRLIARADVFVCNVRPKALDRARLDMRSLAKEIRG